jgi:hypothetical protein
MDASLKLGESVTSDGWTITVKETGAFGDVIEVKKGRLRFRLGAVSFD